MAKCLSFHASYRCRHSGVCCRTDWALPFEAAERTVVERLELVRPGAFRDGEGVSFAARTADGACVFLESDGPAHLCAIHRTAGHAALPVTCRMFPRVVLDDPRGTFVTLSHYCPTAAGMLFSAEGPVAIVEAPPALVDVGPLDGLDAREAVPPLLRDGVVMDLESFGEWERLAIALLTAPGMEPIDAVDRLERATQAIARWTPGSGALIDAVRSALADAVPGAGLEKTGAVQRWLAAHLFGNWIAYQGRGLQTIVRYVRACLDVFTIELARDGHPLEAIRRSDFLIVHEADSQQMANAFDALLKMRR